MTMATMIEEEGNGNQEIIICWKVVILEKGIRTGGQEIFIPDETALCQVTINN